MFFTNVEFICYFGWSWIFIIEEFSDLTNFWFEIVGIMSVLSKSSIFFKKLHLEISLESNDVPKTWTLSDWRIVFYSLKSRETKLL